MDDERMRRLPAVDRRVETGPVQFGDDWPGLFIRGDNVGWYAMAVKRAADESSDTVNRSALRCLHSMLASRAICDLCLLPKLTREDAERFDGCTLAEIQEAVGPRCWHRASGPCIDRAWGRVREIEEAIRAAIDGRPRR